ncbi:MAG: acyl-CoA dehydrogenase family protein [Bacteroidales bacterium]|nr:acyl-CoA dehydrogenase family protein [Bacteroidales bacterium]
MDFSFTEEQLMIKQAARDFARTELLPGVIERDDNEVEPVEQIKKMQEMGFMSMMTDPKYSGEGMDTVSYVLAMEEISKIDASASVVMSIQNSLVNWGLETYASEELNQKYLVPMVKGEAIGAFALSEPEAGSDATKQRTTAIEKDDHYLLNGTKNWISNASIADYFIVIAHTHPEKGHRGINAFIIEKGCKGFEIGPKENKMGLRGSHTHSLMFTDVKIPKENRIGEDGFGFKFSMIVLNGGRIGIAAQALGIAQGALDLSIQYSKERKAFGKLISEHQAIAFKLAEMEVRTEAARNMVYKAAWLKDQHKDYNLASASAKYIAAETAMYVTTEAVQIHGGYGYVKEYHVERLMREAKLTQIYEGTSEIQQIVISREILK